jgi:predicted DNA-binding transcriptional regulator YafY
MRAARLLSEILLLQSHRQITGRAMAKRLEISERTVHRDMEALSSAGVPVFALRGIRGGWQLEPSWRMPAPSLDAQELQALLMSQPRVLADPGLALAAERALQKLMAALPPALQAQADTIRQRLHVDTTAWRGYAEDITWLPLVQDAVSQDRQLEIRYRRPSRESGEDAPAERIVDPLGLVAKGSTWYMVAGTTRGLRTFRVSRIEKARLLNHSSRRPAGFDLAAYWKASTAEFQDGWRRFEAILRLEPRTAEWLKTWRTTAPAYSDRQVRLPASNESAPWPTLRVQFENEDEALFVALGLGAHGQVIDPPALQTRVAKERAAALAHISGGSSPRRLRPAPSRHRPSGRRR